MNHEDEVPHQVHSTKGFTHVFFSASSTERRINLSLSAAGRAEAEEEHDSRCQLEEHTGGPQWEPPPLNMLSGVFGAEGSKKGSRARAIVNPQCEMDRPPVALESPFMSNRMQKHLEYIDEKKPFICQRLPQEERYDRKRQRKAESGEALPMSKHNPALINEYIGWSLEEEVEVSSADPTDEGASKSEVVAQFLDDDEDVPFSHHDEIDAPQVIRDHYNPSVLKKNERILDELKKLQHVYACTGEQWRAFAYSKAIGVIRRLQTEVTCAQQLVGVSGIGEKIRTKIDEIIRTGTSRKLQFFENESEPVKALKELGNIWGVGPATAKTLFEVHHIHTADELRLKLSNSQSSDVATTHQKTIFCEGGKRGASPLVLSSVQQKGLVFYEDLLERIPRKEVECIQSIVKGALERVLGRIDAAKLTVRRRRRHTLDSLNEQKVEVKMKEDEVSMKVVGENCSLPRVKKQEDEVHKEDDGYVVYVLTPPPVSSKSQPGTAARSMPLLEHLDGSRFAAEKKLVELVTCGSFRRGKPTSGDVDILICDWNENRSEGVLLPMLLNELRTIGPSGGMVVPTEGKKEKEEGEIGGHSTLYEKHSFIKCDLTTSLMESQKEVGHCDTWFGIVQVPDCSSHDEKTNPCPCGHRSAFKPGCVTEEKSVDEDLVMFLPTRNQASSPFARYVHGKHLSRRLDIKVYRPNEFPFAVLYFTGSDYFNRSMRLYAQKRGFSLSDRWLKPVLRRPKVKAGSKAEKVFEGTPVTGIHQEEDIFTVLGLPYRTPLERDV